MPGFVPAARSFSFGKRTQNHLCPATAPLRYLRPRPKNDSEQLAEPVLSFVEGLKQAHQMAEFGQGLSRAQGGTALHLSHSRRLLAGIHFLSVGGIDEVKRGIWVDEVMPNLAR
jgi:hypothetical protein